MLLQGQVALITGGARGIGRSIAERLTRDGAAIALLDLLEEAGRETVAALSSRGSRAAFYPVDITSSRAVDQAVERVQADFSRIDILVNNAGVTRDGLLLRMKDEDWDFVLNVNLRGAFLVSRAVARPMLKARQGCIVNIASVVGRTGNAGQANYAASKAGLLGLTKALAREFASRGVRVNAVAPGYIQTAMTEKLPSEARGHLVSGIPLGRLGTAADVAEAARFLAGPESSYITGQVLGVCGGMAM